MVGAPGGEGEQKGGRGGTLPFVCQFCVAIVGKRRGSDASCAGPPRRLGMSNVPYIRTRCLFYITIWYYVNYTVDTICM